MFLSIPRMAPRWLYMVMLFLLQLTQLSSQLSFVNKNIYLQKFPNQLYFQRKSHNVCYIQSCYIADTCTERATHFRLSSGRHIHAWRAYFYSLSVIVFNCQTDIMSFYLCYNRRKNLSRILSLKHTLKTNSNSKKTITLR